MLAAKTVFGTLSLVFAAIAYGSYIYKVFQGQIKPHLFTWLVWGFAAGIVCAAQMMTGAGAGGWTAGFAAFCCTGIAILALFKGDKTYTRSDWLALVAAFIAIILWVLTTDPFYAVLLLTLTDAIGYLPTFRKAFHKPDEESWFPFVMVVLQEALALLALTNYNRVTVTYPIAVLILDAGLAVMLIWRRKLCYVA